MSFTDRLNQAMTLRRFTQDQLAKKVGMAQSAVWKLTSGYSKSTRKAVEIANALNVNPNWLVSGIGSINAGCVIDKLEYVGKVKEGTIIVKGEAVMGSDGAFEMDESFNGRLKFYSDDPNAFALKVKGDSMFPRINSGEFVVIEPKIIPCAGEEVFVRLKNGKNMIKKMEYHRNLEYRFTSINQNHLPITIDEDFVDKVMFVAAIVKSSRYIDIHEI